MATPTQQTKTLQSNIEQQLIREDWEPYVKLSLLALLQNVDRMKASAKLSAHRRFT